MGAYYKPRKSMGLSKGKDRGGGLENVRNGTIAGSRSRNVEELVGEKQEEAWQKGKKL